MNNRTIEAVFLDRDGTIGGDDSIHYPGEFKLFSYTNSVISRFHNDGAKVFSFTNQPGISNGKAIEQDFVSELMNFGFDDVFICPHDSQKGCYCRKPNIGMLQEAQHKHQIDFKNSVVIGDRWSDIVAASKAGCVKILVKTGAGSSSLGEHYDKLKDIEIDYIAEDLKDATEWIYQNYQVGK